MKTKLNLMFLLMILFVTPLSIALAADQSPIPKEAGPFKVEILAENLNMPWSLKVTPDGRYLLFTSRDNGEISQLDLKTKNITKIATVSGVRFTWQAGLLGMDLDPQFSKNREVYICYSTGDEKINPENRVSKFILPVPGSTTAMKETILLDHIPGHKGYHNGCQVVVGKDKRLYISTGDAANDPYSANVNIWAGKVLRIELDGRIPQDNPFPNSPVFTLGHRNPLGLAVHPETGDIWSTEHGPSTQDELNKLIKGRNYGWPTCLGVTNCGNPDFEPAQAEFNTSDTVAISELMFYSGKKKREWKNNIFFVTLKTARLYRVEVENGQAKRHEILFDWMTKQQRLRDMVESPEGDIIVSTENYPNPTSRIIRLIPN